MRKKIMAVYDVEKGFVERLVAFAGQELGLPFSVFGFTEEEKLSDFCKKERVSLLLLAKALVTEATALLPADQVVCLAEEPVKKAAGLPAISRYQPARSLLLEAFSLLNQDSANASSAFTKSRVRTIGVYSPNTGCKKTSFLLALGQQLARKRPSLFLTLEDFSGLRALLLAGESAVAPVQKGGAAGSLLREDKGITVPVREGDAAGPLLRGDKGITAPVRKGDAAGSLLREDMDPCSPRFGSRGLSDLLFLLRQGEGDWAAAVASCTLPFGKLDILMPPAFAGELFDVSSREWERFFDLLREKTAYEFLLVDVGGGAGNLREILLECDRLYLPAPADFVEKARTEEFQAFLEREENRDILPSLCTVHVPALRGEELSRYPRQLEWTSVGKLAKEVLEKDGIFR